MSATKCTRILMEEHKTILRALNVLNAMAAQAESGEVPARGDVHTLLEFLRTFGDDLHQGKEEAVLFPIFTSACTKSEFESVSHLIFEHNQERSLIEGMEDALLTNSRADFIYFAKRLVETLENHIYKEDHILFELIDRTLSPREDERAVAGFQEMDRAVSLGEDDALFTRLRGLEWKYLGKVTAQSA